MKFYAYELAPHSPVVPSDDIFPINTCQRSVVLSLEEQPGFHALRSFRDIQAYDYLLRFACGLESQIKGETDVFGQVKSAYKTLELKQPDLAEKFQTIFLKLLEDTKELRANFLRGIGGNTYGALARRLLNPQKNDQVLVLGAGQISKSIAPYFAEAKLSIYNRSEARLNELKQELNQKGYPDIHYLQGDVERDAALAEATIILICTPPGSELDAKTIGITQLNTKARVFHFGAQSGDLSHFENAHHLKDRFFSLTQIFELEKTQGSFRDRRVAQALRACKERAILRSMSRSIHIAHGWEDLTAFY